MRIAIPTDDEVRIAAHTGRCKSFAVLDVDGGAAQWIEVRGNVMEGRHHAPHQHHDHDSHGAHGHSHHGLLDLLGDCQVMIATGMGPRLIEDLERRGIDVVFTTERDLRKAADAYAKGELAENPRGSACHHKHQHQHGGE